MYTDKITQAIAEAAKKILEGEKLHPNQQKIDVVDDEKIDGKDFAKLRAMKKEEVEQVEEDFSNEKRVRNRVARANDDHEYSQGVADEKRKEGLYDPIAINRLKKTDKAADAAHSGIKKTAVASFIKNRKGDGKVRTEEVERIDEISTKTLAHAARAASDPDSDYLYGKSHDAQKFADHAKKTKDAKSAAAVQGAADGKGHYPRHDVSGRDKLADRTPSRVTASGKMHKQDASSLKKKIKEEVEGMVQPSFSDLLESYREGGLKGFFENFQVVQEEPTNDEYTAEVKKAQAKSEGKDKADVAKAAVQAVQNEEVEQIDELKKETLKSYLKKSKGRSDDMHDKGDFAKTEKEADFFYGKRALVSKSRKGAELRVKHGVYQSKKGPRRYNAEEVEQIDNED